MKTSHFKKITEKCIGGVYVIAEACDNHMGSIEMARALARLAKDSGADAVKFQHHLPDEEMLKCAEMSSNFDEHLYDFLVRNALSLEEHTILKNYCDSIGIQYLCTPFSLKAALEIKHLVPFFKIGSGEFIDRWFIDGLVEISKPVIFSTGMCSEKELIDNANYIKSKSLDFALLNCLSEYPPKFEDMNINYITEMKKIFPETVIGHSDHTKTSFTSVVAVANGAEIIEKHITLSDHVHGPDKDVSLNSSEFTRLVYEVKNVKKVVGSLKKLHEKEVAVRKWAYRSVVAACHIPNGTIITKDHLVTKRPGTGIASKDYKLLIGKRTQKDIAENTLISWSDVVENIDD